MASREDERAYQAYRDAIGMVMAARRGDTDAIEWMLVWQPSLKSRTTDAYVAIICALMRELDRRGGRADELLERWAANLAAAGQS